MIRSVIVGTLLVGCGRIDFDDVAVTYRAAVLADAPIAYWRLDDISSIATDTTGNIDGAYTTGCQRGVTGALADDADTAVDYDGTSCAISLPDPPSLVFPNNAPFSIELWVSETSNTDYYHYFTREVRNASDPVNGYALFQSPLTLGVSLERVVDLDNVQTPAVQIDSGRFVYLVAVYDNSASRIYVDGALKSTTTDPRPMSTFDVVPLIGAHSMGAFFAGTMDEVAIYDHPLTVERIALHYQIGVDGPQ